MAHELATPRLLRPIDRARDHVRGDLSFPLAVSVVGYEDFLCPYCHRFREVTDRLREVLGDRLVFVFRHFPNERAHPGAELAARASEAADRQGRFWDMHDLLFGREAPLHEDDVLAMARALGLDLERFTRDLDSEPVRARVEEDREEGRRNGVTGTPTLFVDGLRYDGAWDFHSMLEALERPVAARVHRSARAFASLPTSAGLVLLIAAIAALAFANTPLAPIYERAVDARIAVGPTSSLLALPVRDWFSEGLLSVFFLLVGLEVRREMTSGALANLRAAVLPVVCAFGGAVVPALLYLALNHGPTAIGWSIPTATDIAFTLGILAVLGSRVPSDLRVVVAALAVVDDVLSVLTLAIFYPHSFAPLWLLAGIACVVLLALLNRWRVYVTLPYLAVSGALWLCLHHAGVHAALAGVFLALVIPTTPAPESGALLAQAAAALTAVEHAEREAAASASEKWRLEHEPIWDWARRNVMAASERLVSPAERLERAVAPWSSFLILPLFAFSSTGVRIHVDPAMPDIARMMFGIVLGLVVGKPLGIVLAGAISVKAGLASAPAGVTFRQLVGAAFLCGVAYTVAVLMTDQAFSDSAYAPAAKIAVIAASVIAAAIGVAVLLTAPRESSADA